MKKIADILTFELEAAFEKVGYDKQYAKVTLSNRPDLCEYQCVMARWRRQKLIRKHRS